VIDIVTFISHGPNLAKIGQPGQQRADGLCEEAPSFVRRSAKFLLNRRGLAGAVLMLCCEADKPVSWKGPFDPCRAYDQLSAIT